MKPRDWFVGIVGICMWMLGVAFCVRTAMDLYWGGRYAISAAFALSGVVGLIAFIVAIESYSNEQ